MYRHFLQIWTYLVLESPRESAQMQKDWAEKLQVIIKQGAHIMYPITSLA